MSDTFGDDCVRRVATPRTGVWSRRDTVPVARRFNAGFMMTTNCPRRVATQ